MLAVYVGWEDVRGHALLDRRAEVTSGEKEGVQRNYSGMQ